MSYCERSIFVSCLAVLLLHGAVYAEGLPNRCQAHDKRRARLLASVPQALLASVPQALLASVPQAPPSFCPQVASANS